VNEDKATRYHRHKRRMNLIAVAWTATLLLWSLVGGWIGALAAWASGASGVPTAWTAVVVVVVVLSVAHELGALPIRYYDGFILERRYGLSNERAGVWLSMELKSFLLGGLLSVVAVTALYACIRAMPSVWWVPAGVLFVVVYVLLGGLAPVLLLPAFYRVTPLARAPLADRLRDLAGRAGAEGVGVYEWHLGARTRKANALLAGLGSSRRVLVSDTMLDACSDDEVATVLAHELAHHRYADIWKGLAADAVVVMLGLFAAGRVLAAPPAWTRVGAPDDVAGLPLVLLVVGAMWCAARPAVNALSRFYERRADRFALELTRNPDAFVSLVRRLAAQNLAEEQPSKVVEWCFYSHPSTASRIAAARRFTA
jgi:STE24 endopeptidase